jgi:hypothetical protein
MTVLIVRVHSRGFRGWVNAAASKMRRTPIRTNVNGSTNHLTTMGSCAPVEILRVPLADDATGGQHGLRDSLRSRMPKVPRRYGVPI